MCSADAGVLHAWKAACVWYMALGIDMPAGTNTVHTMYCQYRALDPGGRGAVWFIFKKENESKAMRRGRFRVAFLSETTGLVVPMDLSAGMEGGRGGWFS